MNEQLGCCSRSPTHTKRSINPPRAGSSYLPPLPQLPRPHLPGRLGSTYFRRDEVWGSPGGHEPPAGVRAGSVVVFLGLLLPAPRLPCPSRAALPVCREVLVANAAWHRLAYYSPARPPASRPQGTASAPPAPRRRGRRDPRPRPLPTQSFGGGGKCPGSGAASGGSGRAGFPPSSSSPPYRLPPPPPPPPLLLPRSPWGCSPAARNYLQSTVVRKQMILLLMYHQKVSSSLMLRHNPVLFASLSLIT
ncbi:protein enabled homolog [Acinonyx jubatus]|uniref:Protein enabled homolog n=1 Tax=Acinonyx jubatus TaxID=32536 RepID=A0ABM3PYM5_ACIJB|nr:protein enabled homolog [Acinonyx jubatus]